MAKILFITGRYLPKPSANGICCENIINVLSSHKHKITCVAFADNKETISACDEKVIKVHHLYHTPLYALEEYNTLTANIKINIINLFHKAVMLLLFPLTPWNDIVYTLRLYKRIKKLHKCEKFDIVIAVHMPLASVIVGCKIKKKYPQIKFIPWFLDSLSGGIFPRFITKNYSLKKRLKWEDDLLAQADKIIFMESSHKNNDKYNVEKPWYKNTIYLDIPYLVNNNSFACNENNKHIKITFTGLLNYPLRNIQYLLSIAKEMGNEVEFIFIGSTNSLKLFNEASPNVSYHTAVPHDKLFEYLIESDVFLNLGVKTPCAISGKIFEYMSYGKPIISTYSIDNEASIPYLKKYPLALLLDEREPDVKLQANRILEFIASTKNKKVDFNELESLFYNNTPQAYVDVIENEFSV